MRGVNKVIPIGNATDVWTAFCEGRLGPIRPFLGYFFLLEDVPRVHLPVRPSEPYFPVDSIFKGASYSQRYQILCQRLVLERLYDAACLTLATPTMPTRVSHPRPELDLAQFAAQLQERARAFVQVQRARS
jgi:hypothetical protein